MSARVAGDLESFEIGRMMNTVACVGAGKGVRVSSSRVGSTALAKGVVQ